MRHDVMFNRKTCHKPCKLLAERFFSPAALIKKLFLSFVFVFFFFEESTYLVESRLDCMVVPFETAVYYSHYGHLNSNATVSNASKALL